MLSIPLVFMYANNNVVNAETESEFQYDCELDLTGDDFTMPVTIEANVPTEVDSGEEFMLSDTTVTVEIPEEIVETAGGVTDSLSGEVTTFTMTSENEDSTIHVADPPIAIPDQELPDEGTLEFTVPEGGVDAGPVTAGEDGAVTLSAEEFDATLDAGLLDVNVDCVPPEDNEFASIDIGEDGDDPAPEPSIELNGDDPLEIDVGEEFADVDPGAEATDEEDGDLTDDIDVDTEDLDTSEAGEYTVTYSVENSEGESASVEREVIVIDEEEDPAPEPEIDLIGEDPLEIDVGEDFADVDPGAEATEEEDGDLTDDIDVDTGDLDTSEPGEYTVTYSVENSEGESASVDREVIVIDEEEDPAPVPEIDLIGGDPLEIGVGTDFDEADPGAEATEEEEGDLTDEVDVDTGNLDTSEPGEYTVTYSVENSAGETASVEREVVVVEEDDPEDPVGSIELEGNEEMELEVGDDFDDPGFTVVDEEGNELDEVEVTVEGEVDTTKTGTNELTYSVENNDEIDSVTRTVNVVDPDDDEDPGAGNGSGGPNGDNGSNGSNGTPGIGNGDRDNGSNGSPGIGNGDHDNGDRDIGSESGTSDRVGSDFITSDEGGALPDTAGNTPFFILVGSLLAIVGGALLFRRKLSLT
ncbi:DUF5011 domain-containing protein [Salicibibacter halophilus]|uniref:DUF5011 domain-containing protein n=1 Tax=Salicibibacter halophilus TaxID=2502791 RepID=A0A514LJM5_9BACI|nr:immunoglobulin-like domain-containing protein [Salicibibacter halophilus]QDI92057.1 DUF5011 domain-containing protein [Salicibibacter halophilus]